MRIPPLILGVILTGCAVEPTATTARREDEQRRMTAAARMDREMNYHRYSITTSSDHRIVKLDSETGTSWLLRGTEWLPIGLMDSNNPVAWGAAPADDIPLSRKAVEDIRREKRSKSIDFTPDK